MPEPIAPAIRRPLGAYERFTNAHQAALIRAYDAWATGTRREVASVAKRGATVGEAKLILGRRLPLLEKRMQAVTAVGIKKAVKMGLGQVEPSVGVKSILARRLLENRTLVATHLIPRIGETIAAKLAPGLTKVGLQGALLAPRSFPASYAGGAWVMIFDVQKQAGTEQDDERRKRGEDLLPVRWVLDPAAAHCQASDGRLGCVSLEGEYASWADLPTVPGGNVTCLGNCRCHLEAYRDGAWHRGLE